MYNISGIRLLSGNNSGVGPVQRLRHYRLREVIDKGNFGLGQMTHICVTYFQCIPSPSVDLTGSCSPHDIVEEHVGCTVKSRSFDGWTQKGMREIRRFCPGHREASEVRNICGTSGSILDMTNERTKRFGNVDSCHGRWTFQKYLSALTLFPGIDKKVVKPFTEVG